MTWLVIAWAKNNNVTLSDCFICFILTVNQSAALAACVLRATTKKGRQLFLRKKSTSGDLPWGFSDLEWPVSFTALAFASDDMPHDLIDLEMTWLPLRPGTATGLKAGPWKLVELLMTQAHISRLYWHLTSSLWVLTGSKIVKVSLSNSRSDEGRRQEFQSLHRYN